MRVAWISFDTIGRDTVRAAAEVGADVVAILTLPGPLDSKRSGQCRFDGVAAELGAALVEARDANAPEAVAALCESGAEAVFVVGWSQLLRDELIAAAPAGVFGMHPTLLPRHRGRAPVPWTILNGLARTGVTLFQITDATADSGPIVGQAAVDVDPDETATTLFGKLARAHVELVREYVPLLSAGTAPRTPQDDSRASVWPKRTPTDGIIDWETRAPYLYDWVRAQTRPYPGAFTFCGDERLIVWRARPVDAAAAPSGTVLELRDGAAVVACGEGALLLEEIEGPPLEVGARLG